MVLSLPAAALLAASFTEVRGSSADPSCLAESSVLIVDELGGQGLATSRAIEMGDEVISVPRSLCFSARDAPSWAIGSKSSLLASRLCSERAVLGSFELEAPVAWTDDEAEMLSGTRAGRARAQLLKDWKADWVSSECTWEDFRWAKCVVASRCYELSEDTGPVYIPYLDLANHDDQDFLAIDLDKKDDMIYFKLVATRSMRKGESVRTNYFGGRPADPVKALDAFGWLISDIPHFRGIICRNNEDLRTSLLPALQNDHLVALDLVQRALSALEDPGATEKRQRRANAVVENPHQRRRILKAQAIVEAERYSLHTIRDLILEDLSTSVN